MPGVAIVSGGGRVDKAYYTTALRGLAQPGYTCHPLDCGADIAVGYAVHPGYPIVVLSDDGSVVVLEGAVYDVDDASTRSSLMSILRTF
jgi:hypothetical protein